VSQRHRWLHMRSHRPISVPAAPPTTVAAPWPPRRPSRAPRGLEWWMIYRRRYPEGYAQQRGQQRFARCLPHGMRTSGRANLPSGQRFRRPNDGRRGHAWCQGIHKDLQPPLDFMACSCPKSSCQQPSGRRNLAWIAAIGHDSHGNGRGDGRDRRRRIGCCSWWLTWWVGS
jgi:hypothetical protein